MNEAVWMGSHADLGCSRPIHSKTSLRRHPLNHRQHPYPDQHAAHSAFLQQLYQGEDGIKPVLHCLLLPVSHVPCLAAFSNECTATWDGYGVLSHASEQPCSAQILISALTWSRTGDIHCLGMATDPLCDRLHSQISSEGPGALQGQTL